MLGGGWRVITSPAIASSVTLASLGIGAAGLATYFWRGTLTDAGNGVTEQVFWQVDDGTNANRFYTRNPSPNTTTTLVRFLASVAATISPGSIADGVEFRIATAILGDGAARCSLNGAAAVGLTGGPTAGLTTLRFGRSATGSDMTGSIAEMRIRPGVALSDAALIALTS